MQKSKNLGIAITTLMRSHVSCTNPADSSDASSATKKWHLDIEKQRFRNPEVWLGGKSRGHGTVFAISAPVRGGSNLIVPTQYIPDEKVETMTRRTCASAILWLVLVAAAALQASAAPVLNVYYTGSSGNIKVQNTTASSLAVQSFNILTLGDATQGVASGLPGNIGYLNVTAATMPTGAFLTSNTSAAGLNGIYSQVYAANVGTAMFTLTANPGWTEAEPIGPVGSYWDLGNIAPTGLTQADIDTYFLTDFEITPPDFETSAYGKFLFTYEISPGEFSADTIGDVKVVPQGVPEPSTFAMLISAVACGGWMAGRGKSRSAKIAGFSAGRGTFRDVGGIRTVGCAT